MPGRILLFNKGIKNARGKNTVLYPALLFLLILSPNIYYTVAGSDFSSSGLILRLAFLALCTLLIALPLAIISLRAFFWIGLGYVLLAPLELFHLYLYHAPISNGMLDALFRSNRRESMEVVANYWQLAPGFLFLIVLYIFVLIKKVQGGIYFPWRIRAAIPIAAILLLSLLYAQQIALNHKTFPYKKTGAILVDGFETFTLKFYKIYPYSLIRKYIDIRTYREQANNYLSNTKAFNYHAIQEKGHAGNQVFVVILGETTRPDHWGINGYQRPTSPQLAKEKNIISFRNMASCGNITSISLPFILTGIPPGDFSNFPKYKSFIEAFKEAGFYSAWISNQNIINLSSGEMGVPQIKDADSIISLNTSFDYDEGYDEKLLPVMGKILDKKHEKLLIVLHTMGSHFRYNFRYPKAFEKFRPAFSNNFDNGLMKPENLNTIINTYDNSVLYTDWFISRVIRRIKASGNMPEAVLYIGDHGENLCDDKRHLFYHGTPFITPWEIQVPFFIWYSDAYQYENAGIVKALKENSAKRISSTSFFATLAGIAGIHYNSEDSRNNAASTQYTAPQKRIILNPDMKAVRYD
jgi:glucan phosphoethanolaminetransferase (alkaline phosphatase superfamily)